MIQFFRYVIYNRVFNYMRLGWMVAADLGPPHSEYSCLMCWPCSCKCVEPV